MNSSKQIGHAYIRVGLFMKLYIDVVWILRDIVIQLYQYRC